ncbi:Uma2 family endonuclease [Archangium primigenium]|uniref:Uma2 family endonuclease n=1 Tax=[Archangium] primigenium TaxID=2792470 RepID=UPI00195EC7E9|nr:Uma2 family endonuclease [Archangium primigenium]MBM7112656.1 Uma2 family endonuclease [Archangium primigenium]
MGKVKFPATYEDLEALPVGWVGELIDDALWAFPRPAKWNAWSASALGVRLGAAFGEGQGGRGGWWVLDEPELHLGAQVLVPDLAAWRCERVPDLFARDAPAFDVAPDWVCEVLSPSTAALDRGRKLALYHQQGVGHAWLVDPRARTVEVFRREPPGWRTVGRHGGDEVIHAEPFGAEPLPLVRLWAPPRPVAPGDSSHQG